MDVVYFGGLPLARSEENTLLPIRLSKMAERKLATCETKTRLLGYSMTKRSECGVQRKWWNMIWLDVSRIETYWRFYASFLNMLLGYHLCVVATTGEILDEQINLRWNLARKSNMMLA